MEELRSWYKDRFKIGELSEKQLQVVYEAAAISRSGFLRWLYDNNELSQAELEILKEQAQKLGYA